MIKKEERKRKLAIVSGVGCLPDKDRDLLALTLPVMADFDRQGRNYLSLDDFYSLKQGAIDAREFSSLFICFLKSCDEIALKEYGVQRAFSSNSFWFLHRLLDLYYIQNIIQVIDECYNDIEIWVQRYDGTLPKIKIDFSSLNISCYGYGIDHLVQFICFALQNSKINSGNVHLPVNSSVIGGEPGLYLLFRMPELIFKNVRKVVSQLRIAFSKKQGVFWSVQNGYDVDALKEYMGNWRFEYVTGEVSKKLNSLPNQKHGDGGSSSLELIAIFEDFFNKYFPSYDKWLVELMCEYASKIVSNMPSVEKIIDELMRKKKPKALLYSIGSETILEECFAIVANNNNIPVFYFKHSGVENIFLEPGVLDEVLECNCSIKRTQFVENEIEYKKFVFYGCRDLFPALTGRLSRRPRRRHRKKKYGVLYSVGPPAHFTFKEQGKIISDYDRHKFSSILIAECEKQAIDLAVKVHPAEWPITYNYYDLINKEKSNGGVDLLVGGSIETMMYNAEVLVLDIISTRVLSSVLESCNEIPVVIYVPYGSLINEDTFIDLELRTYIVRNKEQLVSVLKRYVSGNLSPKKNERFDNKYFGPYSNKESYNFVVEMVSK